MAEKFLWEHVPEPGHVDDPFVRDVIEHMLVTEMIASPKQAWRTLEKWCAEGCYDYGCVLDRGWRRGSSCPARLRKVEA